MTETEEKLLPATPYKMDQNTQDVIVKSISMGATMAQAAAAAGIAPRTLLYWRTDSRPEFEEFQERIHRAKAQRQIKLMKTVQDAADNGDWRAAVRLLESLDPDNWSRHLVSRTDQEVTFKKALQKLKDKGIDPHEFVERLADELRLVSTGDIVIDAGSEPEEPGDKGQRLPEPVGS